MARYFKEQDIDEFRECFYLFARSGQITSLDELTVVMRSLGMSPTIQELTGYLKEKGGKVSFADFLEVLHIQCHAVNLPKEDNNFSIYNTTSIENSSQMSDAASENDLYVPLFIPRLTKSERKKYRMLKEQGMSTEDAAKHIRTIPVTEEQIRKHKISKYKLMGKSEEESNKLSCQPWTEEIEKEFIEIRKKQIAAAKILKSYRLNPIPPPNQQMYNENDRQQVVSSSKTPTNQQTNNNDRQIVGNSSTVQIDKQPLLATPSSSKTPTNQQTNNNDRQIVGNSSTVQIDKQPLLATPGQTSLNLCANARRNHMFVTNTLPLLITPGQTSVNLTANTSGNQMFVTNTRPLLPKPTASQTSLNSIANAGKSHKKNKSKKSINTTTPSNKQPKVISQPPKTLHDPKENVLIYRPKRVTIAPVDEKESLSLEDTKIIENAILSYIDIIPFGGWTPQFDGCFFNDGKLIVVCANEKSVRWLRGQIQDIKPWKSNYLRLCEELSTATAFISGPKLSPDTILKRLRAQNMNLNCKEWKIVDMKWEGNGYIVKFAFDAKVHTSLKDQDFQLYFGLGRIRFLVDDGIIQNQDRMDDQQVIDDDIEMSAKRDRSVERDHSLRGKSHFSNRSRERSRSPIQVRSNYISPHYSEQYTELSDRSRSQEKVRDDYYIPSPTSQNRRKIITVEDTSDYDLEKSRPLFHRNRTTDV